MSKRYWLVVAVIALSASLAGTFVARMLVAPAVPALESGTLFPQSRALAPFSLFDHRGNAVGADMFRGQPSLVFFGFTHCPDVCPTTLALLTDVRRRAGFPDLQIVLVSVDPERDTSEQLKNYVAAFASDLIGLTGEPSEIMKTTRAFGVAATRVDLPGGTYTMDHSATVFALDAGGRITAVFTPPLDAAVMARDLVRLGPRLQSAEAS